MQEPPVEICPECRLPLIECSGLAEARFALQHYLVMHDYCGRHAVETADRLIPHRRPTPYLVETGQTDGK